MLKADEFCRIVGITKMSFVEFCREIVGFVEICRKDFLREGEICRNLFQSVVNS